MSQLESLASIQFTFEASKNHTPCDLGLGRPLFLRTPAVLTQPLAAHASKIWKKIELNYLLIALVYYGDSVFFIDILLVLNPKR